MRGVLSPAKPKSNGRAGEEAAGYWFHRHRWYMTKTEPPVRNLGPVKNRPGVFKAVYTEGGMPDFVGYVRMPPYDACVFCACEVKEATPSEDDVVPHSRLSDEQRAFLADLPDGCAYVGILWRNGAFEVFPFSNERGSYKKGHGIK
jgi:hypothetical protein